MAKRVIYIVVLLLIPILIPAQGLAFWIWTPETNKWVNPKYAVKETPGEQLQYAIEYIEAEDYNGAIRELRKLLKHYPRAKEAPEAQYHIGQCFQAQGKIFEAFKQYQEVIDKYPFSELAGDIVKKQYDIGVEILEGRRKRNKIVETLAGDHYNIVEVFRTVIKNAPYGEYAPSAQYKIGLYLQEKKMYQEARDEYEKVINDYPESEWSKAAKYQIAITDAERSADSQYDQKITQSAVEELKDFVATYPDAELSQDAKQEIRRLKEKEAENNYLIAQFYEKQRNYKAAKIYYQIVVDQYNESPWTVPSLKKIRELSQKEK